MPDRIDAGLWATHRKAFIELQRERDRQFDPNTMSTCDSEWWRGYEAALDDLIRTVTAEQPTATLDPVQTPEALAERHRIAEALSEYASRHYHSPEVQRALGTVADDVRTGRL